MKKVLLARPSSLIVANMQKLMTTLGLEPTRLQEASELQQHERADVACIVVSTALTSTVNESYCEMVMKVRKAFPSKPIFIASFADISRSKLIVNAKLRESRCPMSLISMTEAADQKLVDFSSHCILITNNEIKEEPHFSNSIRHLRTLLTPIHKSGSNIRMR